MDKEESKRLSEILKKAEQTMGTLEGGKATTAEVLPKVIKMIQEFRALSQEWDLKGLVQVADCMERYAKKPSLTPEDITTLTFAVGFLRGGVADGSSEGVRAAIIETLELLGIDSFDVSVPFDADEKKRPKKKAEASWMPGEQIAKPAPEAKKPEEPVQKKEEAPPVRKEPEVKAPPPPKPKIEKKAPEPVQEPSPEDIDLNVIADRLGGKLVMPEEGSGDPVTLEISPENLEKVKRLLSPFDPNASLAEQIPSSDDRMKEVMDSVKEFMSSFAEGNLERAQEILEDLSEYQGDGELFTEIGGLARGLHDSLSDFASNLNPDLRDLVEEKIPDSGNRLEHIMKLTEEAANTTLDYAEGIQTRFRGDTEKLNRLNRHLAMLMPIGDAAYGRMDESTQIIRELLDSLNRSHEDLGTILTAQGYQDLTGQVIGKVVDFQKDLEGKLVGLVRSFGVRVTKKKEKQPEAGLYGPAHDKKDGALHSQDEVDDILAQFGF